MESESTEPSLPPADEAPDAQATIAGRRGRVHPPASHPPNAISGERSRSGGAHSSASHSAVSASLAGRPSLSRASTSDSALSEAMAGEEAARAHGFSGVIALISFGVAAFVPWLGGDRVAQVLCLCALLAIGAFSLGVLRITHGPGRYTLTLHRAYGATLVLGVMFVEYYLGPFSPVPVILTLGIYYLGQHHDRRSSFALPALAMASYAVLGGLVATGVLQDRGLFRATTADPGTLVFAIAAVTAVLAITLRMARVSRRSVLDAIRRSNDALLMAQAREMQLQEAHQNLDRALRAAVGKAGRFTGHRAGPFELEVLLGIGAMGEVYAARHTRDGTPAAVKLPAQDVMADDALVQRFLREGEISASIESPHVVRVLEVGQLDAGAPYLAMERLEGTSLSNLLRDRGQLDVPDAVRLAEHLAQGLEVAHARGVVHRDLKPHNLFLADSLDDEARWKILDFGISKLSDGNGTLTQHRVVGTPGYMSPEQTRAGDVDHRSDLFSMAVVLYRALTGRQAFPGTSTPQILFDIVYRSPERPSLVNHLLPTDVDLVLAIALAKDPDIRFQSASELARALRAAAKQKLGSELRARGHGASKAYPWGEPINLRGG